MQSFPSLKSLALASEDQVLAHWSGLGYYSRARNLHKTAQIIQQTYRGRFPKEVEHLCTLPGIGRSTAGAILSLSMKIRAPILDGNVKRVLIRFAALEGQINDSALLKKLWQLADQYTPIANVNHYNQAMMDLGATLCTRTKPDCQRCPLIKNCQAYAMQRVADFPQRKKLKQNPTKQIQLLILQNTQGELLLEKRPPTGVWGGLWSFPECEINQDISRWCQRRFATQVTKTHALPYLYHQFSHFKLEMRPMILIIKNNVRKVMESSLQIWYKLSDPLPGGIAKPIAQLLKELQESPS